MMLKSISFAKLSMALLVLVTALSIGGASVSAQPAPTPTPAPGASTNDPAASKFSLTGCDASIPADDCNVMAKYLNPFITLLSILVGISVTIGIISGGILYSASGGDPSKAAAAKGRIYNSIMALLVYIFLFAFLKFVIPGSSLIST